MKKAKGFTLVELVVVIAIIGVLAAILVPTMLNYVRKAKLKAANTNAKTAYNAVQEFFTDQMATQGLGIDDVLTQYGRKVVDCNIPPKSNLTPAQKAVHDVLAVNGISSGHVWVDKATIAGVDDVVYVQWTGEQNADGNPEAVIGQYPDAISWDTYKSANNAWKTYVAPA